ncbi:TPA: hypothetical protein OT834_002055 [Morganella morganii]|uniref:hypothetical protein n=1 Tax=Morganella morganii TaxID=582 RepID=UPI0022AD33CB|nr:hypothetical protein [Morganella morganii]HCT7641277.1 hypothetical protein [Morganella morganii]
MHKQITIATDISIKLRRYLECNHRNIAGKYRLMLNQFPRNSCEPTSIFLGSLFSKNFGSDNVFIINIDCKKIEGMHFFVEFDKLYYDLTFDQFDFCQDIIIAGDKSPFDGIIHDILYRKNFADFISEYKNSPYNNKELIQLALEEINSAIL